MEQNSIAIIGAGTAGLTAAIYVARAGKQAVVFEKQSYGGQIINTPHVENYPGISKVSGFDFATNLYNQAVDLGVEVRMEKVTGVQKQGKQVIVTTTKGEYEFGSLIIATGASHRKLGVEKEESLIGAGISYCATCDGMFFRGREVAVIGGGNTALLDANFLSNYCNKVYVVHRREEFRGENSLVKQLEEKENVEFVLSSVVEELVGDSVLEGVKLRNTNTHEAKVLDVAGVFVAIGQAPDTKDFGELVSLDEGGYVIAGEDCKTSCEGIFVAGDCRTKQVRQLTTAAADGSVAALAACEYVATLS